jgi:hypothetical protein
MTSSTVLSLSSLVVAVLALLVSAGVAVRQLARLRHSNLLPVALDLFREFRTPEFREHMRYLQDELWDRCPPGDVAIGELGDEARAHVAPVAGYFNNVGVLVANGVVEAELVQSFMGGSILRAWSRTAPYVEVERRRRQDPFYSSFFEHLAALCIRTPPAELHGRLHLERVPGGWTFDVTPHREQAEGPAAG